MLVTTHLFRLQLTHDLRALQAGLGALVSLGRGAFRGQLSSQSLPAPQPTAGCGLTPLSASSTRPPLPQPSPHPQLPVMPGLPSFFVSVRHLQKETSFFSPFPSMQIFKAESCLSKMRSPMDGSQCSGLPGPSEKLVTCAVGPGASPTPLIFMKIIKDATVPSSNPEGLLQALPTGP